MVIFKLLIVASSLLLNLQNFHKGRGQSILRKCSSDNVIFCFRIRAHFLMGDKKKIKIVLTLAYLMFCKKQPFDFFNELRRFNGLIINNSHTLFKRAELNTHLLTA